MPLDVPTLLLLTGGSYLLMGASVWLVLRRPQDISARLWCAGGLVGGVGFLLVGLRGTVDHQLSIAFGQPLMLLGAALVAQSLRADLRRPWAWSVLGALMGAYGLALVWAVSHVDAHIIGVLIRLANLLVVVAIVVSAWEVGRVESSRNARTIAVAYAAQALAILVNLVNAGLGSQGIASLRSSTVLAATSLATLLVTPVVTMAYLGLAIERSRRLSTELGIRLARAQQFMERQQTVLRLDRDRMLAVMGDSLGHSIAQPLTAALLRVQMSRRLLGVDPAKASQGAQQAVEGILRAAEAVQRVRDFVRPADDNIKPVRVDRLLRDVNGLLHQEALKHAVVLDMQPPAGQAWVMGDALQLAQALAQLLRTVITARDTGVRRVVRLRQQVDEGQVSVCIEDDSGPLPAVWQRDASDALAELVAEDGLGLYVVRSIVKAHGGQLLLEDTDRGGARVTLVLPQLAEPALALG